MTESDSDTMPNDGETKPDAKADVPRPDEAAEKSSTERQRTPPAPSSVRPPPPAPSSSRPSTRPVTIVSVSARPASPVPSSARPSARPAPIVSSSMHPPAHPAPPASYSFSRPPAPLAPPASSFSRPSARPAPPANLFAHPSARPAPPVVLFSHLPHSSTRPVPPGALFPYPHAHQALPGTAFAHPMLLPSEWMDAGRPSQFGIPYPQPQSQFWVPQSNMATRATVGCGGVHYNSAGRPLKCTCGEKKAPTTGTAESWGVFRENMEKEVVEKRRQRKEEEAEMKRQRKEEEEMKRQQEEEEMKRERKEDLKEWKRMLSSTEEKVKKSKKIEVAVEKWREQARVLRGQAVRYEEAADNAEKKLKAWEKGALQKLELLKVATELGE